MDPLSITASILTCVGSTIAAADAILKLIDGIKNAPNELLAIYNDVTDSIFSIVANKNTGDGHLFM